MIISSATTDIIDNLSESILNNNDLQTVEAGAPAYLLMIDSFIKGDPQNVSLLLSAATLYTAYADVFVTNNEKRAGRLSEKALNYSLQAMCFKKPGACQLRKLKFNNFEQLLSEMTSPDVPLLFTLGSSWVSWIKSHKNDWNAIAELSRIEVIMKRIKELDDTYQDGGVYLYLGGLATLVPPALGGKPEVGKNYFEKAVKMSNGKNLMAKVIYAQQYARMMFDRKLHDKLLKEVMDANPDIPGYTLINTFAQKQAKALIDNANDYF